ncbi:MAG: T9SS type A sorting domain-containing protein [Bacteroidetes bacterium]|nr:T9SS type A sorting domain-containing protein [Bacteroidota bacterium]
MRKLITLFVVMFFFCANVSLYSQWVAAGSVTISGSYPSISVVSPTVAWVAGGSTSPTIYKTTDGGTTWTSVPVNGLPVKAIMCVWAVSDQIAYVGDGGDAGGTTGGDAAVSVTTNGGTNWTLLFNTGGSAGFFNGVVFSKTNPNYGFAESDPSSGAGSVFYVQKTTNAGANWTLINPPGISGNASAQNSLCIIDNQFFGFGLNNSAVVYLTSNGGTNWYSGALGLSATSLFTSALAFNDAKLIGVAALSGSFPSISRTTNGGTSWTVINAGGSATTTNSALKWINGTNTVYFLGQVAASSCFYKSTDAGLSWTSQTCSGVNFFHFDFVRVGTTVTGYASTLSGAIYKLTETVTLVNSGGTTVPTEYKLEQNYPNPFNPSTTISFSIPKQEFVTLKVYNSAGKEVAVIVNKQLNAGKYEENFNASEKLSSGVYFYKLTAGNFSETRKFMLIK